MNKIRAVMMVMALVSGFSASAARAEETAVKCGGSYNGESSSSGFSAPGAGSSSNAATANNTTSNAVQPQQQQTATESSTVSVPR